jgi:DNA-binding GntR family transcriptional regulator
MVAVGRVVREVSSLRQQVAENLRDAILDGRLNPGQKLIERELCESLDISRTLLREALQQLQAEGLITSVPHKGPSVALIGADEVAELYEVRQALEGLAATSFAAHATDAQIAELALQLKLMRQADPCDPRALLVAKSAFYAVLLNGCGNRVVKQVLTQLNNRMMLFRRLSMSAPGRVPKMFSELEAIVGAIKKRDGMLAGQLSVEHVAQACVTVLAALDAQAKSE